jgi:CubicO group peptidase (beta-lactamase class C family)
MGSNRFRFDMPKYVDFYLDGRLARIVRDVFGGDLAAMVRFARERLFDPAGMTSALLEPDASGTFIGSSFAFMTARDWARFGELFRSDGVWNGRRLLPEGWVRYAATPTPAAPLSSTARTGG